MGVGRDLGAGGRGNCGRVGRLVGWLEVGTESHGVHIVDTFPLTCVVLAVTVGDMTTEQAVRVHLKGGWVVVYHAGRRVSPRFKTWDAAATWATTNGYEV